MSSCRCRCILLTTNLINLSYRTQPCLVTNLVMNLVTNLVITKFNDEFGDIFVTLFGDSPNLVMILMTFSSPHLVGHRISCTFHHAIAKAAGQILLSLFKKLPGRTL